MERQEKNLDRASWVSPDQYNHPIKIMWDAPSILPNRLSNNEHSCSYSSQYKSIRKSRGRLIFVGYWTGTAHAECSSLHQGPENFDSTDKWCRTRRAGSRKFTHLDWTGGGRAGLLSPPARLHRPLMAKINPAESLFQHRAGKVAAKLLIRPLTWGG